MFTMYIIKSKPRSYEGCWVSTFTCSLIWHLVESFMCSGPRENGHNVRKLSEKFANISIPQSSSPQHRRNASYTHIIYVVFSLMVFLTFLYQNHYRHPSTLSIEYEEMRTPASNISRFWYKVNNSVWGWQQQWRVRGWEVSNLLIIE